MQLFSADAMIVSKIFFFALENIKIMPSKIAHNRPQAFFYMYGPAAQTGTELIFHIIKFRDQASVLLFVINTYDLQTLPQCILGKGYFHLLKQCFLRKPELYFEREPFLAKELGRWGQKNGNICCRSVLFILKYGWW